MNHPTETSVDRPDEQVTAQQKVMTIHSHAVACATSNDNYDAIVSDQKKTKEIQNNSQESSQNATDTDVKKQETGLVQAEILEPGESSPSSGVVSPGPSGSSVTSYESSHKSEENQSHKSQHSTPLHVRDKNATSKDERVDRANKNKVGTERNNSAQNSIASSPSTKIHEENKKETSLNPQLSSRVRSDSIQSHSTIRASPASSDSTPKQSQNLRRGKWTLEEEAYVARVIKDFNNGFLDAPAGTTLRTFLSDKLSCDPMRITKKFTGDACIGKRVFHPAVRSPSNSAAIDKAQNELEELERRWRVRMSMQRQESEKKHAASAAAAAAVASAAHVHDPSPTLGAIKTSALSGNRVVVTRTASWLDRANAILSTRRSSNEKKQAKKETYGDEVKKEMKEVELLIQEGPTIQKSSGLLLKQGLHSTTDATGDPPSKRKVSDDQKNTISDLSKKSAVSAKRRIMDEKVDKRVEKSLSLGNVKAEDMKSNFNLSSGEAEDAASFIGFISSVREEAAEAANSNKRYK